MAVHTNDVVLLPTPSFQVKFCENFTNEDISITPVKKHVCSKNHRPKNDAKIINNTMNDAQTLRGVPAIPSVV